MALDTTPAASADFGIMERGFARDLKGAIEVAIADGVRFPGGTRPLAVLRAAVSASIRDIESDERGVLLQRFLRDGPYEGTGRIPKHLAGKRLTDVEVAKAVTFIYAFMVNAFQGQLAELLAAAPCARLVIRLKRDGRLPRGLKLYLGDRVALLSPRRRGTAKGADLHGILVRRGQVSVALVGEVKSYVCSRRRLLTQLRRHIARCREGMLVDRSEFPSRKVAIGASADVVQLGITPAGWKLPRTYSYRPGRTGRHLLVDHGKPREDEESSNRITLRWSQEAIASAAYEMTFWYMAKVGEVIYRAGVPPEWGEMSPAEAGRNAVKMALYYALLRCHRRRVEQRAVALYNTYSFGYALGMSFRDRRGRRQMLWPQDLDEIAAKGVTRQGCRFF